MNNEKHLEVASGLIDLIAVNNVKLLTSRRMVDHQLSKDFKEGCAATALIPAKMQRESGRIANPFTCL